MLEFLAGQDPMPISAVAAGLGLDLAQASREATALQRLGHVRRTTDSLDRRRTLVQLTSATAELLDAWLLSWTGDYLPPAEDWPVEDVIALTAWFTVVHRTLTRALPDRPASRLPERWLAVVPPGTSQPHTREFLRVLIGLVAWIGQSGGFNDLLELVGVPLRENAYMALLVVERHGPMSVAELAERMDIDPSQASKRLRQLTELQLVDRAVDTFDRRSNLVRASSRGVALHQEVTDWQLMVFRLVVGNIAPDDRVRWTELMSRYAASVLRSDLPPWSLLHVP